MWSFQGLGFVVLLQLPQGLTICSSTFDVRCIIHKCSKFWMFNIQLESTIYWNGGWWSRMSIWSFINHIVALENCVANPQNIESASISTRASNLSHVDLDFIVFEVPRLWHRSRTIDPNLPTTKDIWKFIFTS
jgi:hypothetical protein